MSNYREQLGNMPSQFGRGQQAIPWSHQEVKISGNGLTTVHFDSSKPNMFMLQNPNDTTIHIGISRIPTARNYEFKIESNSSVTFGRPVPTDALYILNKGNTDAVISLFSIYDKFDMSILQTLNVDLSKSPIFDGIIKGFGQGTSLPSGSNKIGNVGLSGAIPTGGNLIGKVDVNNHTLKNLYSDVVSDAITVDLSNRNVNYIVFLANDSEEEVYIYLKKPDGNGCGIRLKGGETLNDLPYQVSTMRLTGDNISFRYLVGER